MKCNINFDLDQSKGHKHLLDLECSSRNKPVEKQWAFSTGPKGKIAVTSFFSFLRCFWLSGLQFTKSLLLQTFFQNVDCWVLSLVNLSSGLLPLFIFVQKCWFFIEEKLQNSWTFGSNIIIISNVNIKGD